MINLILMIIGFSCLLVAIILFLQEKLKETQEQLQNVGDFLDTKTGGQNGPITEEIQDLKFSFSSISRLLSSCIPKTHKHKYSMFDYIEENKKDKE